MQKAKPRAKKETAMVTTSTGKLPRLGKRGRVVNQKGACGK